MTLTHAQGVFPANFVEIKESVSNEMRGGSHVITPQGNEVALEAAVALKEWQPELVQYYMVSVCVCSTGSAYWLRPFTVERSDGQVQTIASFYGGCDVTTSEHHAQYSYFGRSELKYSWMA